jgi:glycosyltransferase involved in cell wall biosynthesis
VRGAPRRAARLNQRGPLLHDSGHVTRRKVILYGPLPPPYGGVSVYMSFLVEHLRGRVARVWSVLGDRSKRDPLIRYVRHRRLGVVPALLSEARGARILDATHFHLEHPNKILLPLWLAAKRLLGFEWHKNVHDGSLPARHRDFRPAERRLFRLAARNVTEFVVVSHELRRWLRDEIGVTQPVHVIPALLPIPDATFAAALSDATERALQPYLRRPRRVCSVGAFIPAYGFLHAARAVEALREETNDDIGLALIDGTFARDEEYRRRVLAGRDWIAVVENVPNPQVYQILRRSGCFVRAFGQESYGISRVEATWCGLPVVATTAGETRGMLTYEFGDVDELARQLRRALFERPAREVERWSEEFRREAEENLRALRAVLGID